MLLCIEHQTWTPGRRKELLGLVPVGTSPVGLKQCRVLRGSPSAYLSATSDTTAMPSGLSAVHAHSEEPQSCIGSKGDRVSGAPKSSQPVGLRSGWGGIFHLPFLLRRELHQTLSPLAPLLLLGSLSYGLLCFFSWVLVEHAC